MLTDSVGQKLKERTARRQLHDVWSLNRKDSKTRDDSPAGVDSSESVFTHILDLVGFPGNLLCLQLSCCLNYLYIVHGGLTAWSNLGSLTAKLLVPRVRVIKEARRNCITESQKSHIVIYARVTLPRSKWKDISLASEWEECHHVAGRTHRLGDIVVPVWKINSAWALLEKNTIEKPITH